ncbi:MAG: DUF3445 domain-containing protein [Bacteroidetes bacterium]|nr:DUF3445 domain-containing protein [Bacteroidota bacterium]
MIRYFPFTSAFDLKMGTSPMKESDFIVETDEHYLKEIGLKASLLEQYHDYYYAELPGYRQAAWEVVMTVLNQLVQQSPDRFILKQEDDALCFRNLAIGERTLFKPGQDQSLPFAPLDWIGRQVQEDLILLNKSGEIVAGQLCFPSGWALHEKLGKQFMEVHAPLPSLSMPMIQSANKLVERLPLGKPIARNNWGFRLGDQLDMSSKYSTVYRKRLEEEIPSMTDQEFGRKVFVRVEHQTLSRLTTGDVLFTIHTYHSPLETEVQDSNRAATMLSFLESTPKELLEYKIITPYYSKLISYLRSNVKNG